MLRRVRTLVIRTIRTGMGNAFSQLFPDIWKIRYKSASYEACKPNGIFIALVGRTGSGMSRLIHDATGSYETNVSPEDHLPSEPYTVSIQDYGFTIPGIEFSDFPLFFIDTPGFDYSIDNDEHVALEKLLKWVRRFKPMNTQIDGLIFMHNVCSPELRERTMYMQRKHVIEGLCGKDNLHKVVFVTSHWEDLIAEEREDKEAEIDRYWTWMARNRSGKKKYDTPSSGSAWNILKPLVMVAQNAREERLKKELESLKVHLTPDAYLEINDFLGRKAAFLTSIISRLGEEGFAMTDDEKITYGKFNQEAKLLWRKVEKELNVTELERWLTSGEKEDPIEEP